MTQCKHQWQGLGFTVSGTSRDVVLECAICAAQSKMAEAVFMGLTDDEYRELFLQEERPELASVIQEEMGK